MYSSAALPRQHSKHCAHNKSHNEGDVLDGIDLHSSCVWIQTEVIREVEAKETAQVEHLQITYPKEFIVTDAFYYANSAIVNKQSWYGDAVVHQ